MRGASSLQFHPNARAISACTARIPPARAAVFRTTACADVGSFFRRGPPTALCGLVNLVDALLEQFLGILA